MSATVEGLQIRPFCRKDQAEVRSLILDGLGEHFQVIDESLNPDLDDIEANYLAKGHAFIIADLKGQIVAVGGLILLGEGLGRLVRVSVNRGRRRLGFGGAIVDHLVALAKASNLKRLLVETNHDWHDAIALYERCGFVPYDRDDISVHLQLSLD